jgi:hypothetical protein
VSERRIEITPEPTAQERRAIEIALERSAQPAPAQPAGWLDGDGPGEDG